MNLELNPEDFALLFADEPPPPQPDPLLDAARQASKAFILDGRRVRTERVGELMFAFVVTTNPRAANSKVPTEYGGVEPYRTLRDAGPDVLEFRNGVPLCVTLQTDDADHRVWVIRLNIARLLRLWKRGERGELDKEKTFFVLKQSGEVKSISDEYYKTLRATLQAIAAKQARARSRRGLK